MNILNRSILILSAILLFAGCASFAMINKRAVSIEEIIEMSQANVGCDVIIRQIDSTNSRFKLSSNDIVYLKKANVDEDVIERMIETGTEPYYDYNYYYGYHYYPYNYYPYNSMYFSHRYGYPYINPYIYRRPAIRSYNYYIPIQRRSKSYEPLRKDLKERTPLEIYRGRRRSNR